MAIERTHRHSGLKIRAELKWLHSPDVDDLALFRPEPEDKFGFLLQFFAGPEGKESEESFGVIVCSPRWLAETNASSDVVVGRHHLILQEYDYERLKRFIEDYCASCEGDSWDEVALKVGRLGRWEFEDYRD